MTPRASQGIATAFSRGVADTIGDIIGKSGIPMVTVLADAGISRNYYYKRARYELPFNTNDISNIAQALGISPDSIITAALERAAAAAIPSLDDRRRKNVSGTEDDVEDLDDILNTLPVAADPKGDDPRLPESP